MDPEEFRRFGHQVVDWIADYRARGRVAPGHVARRARADPGAAPGLAARRARGLRGRSSRDLDRVVVPGLSHWQHPRFFGYFPSNGELVVGPRRLPQHRPRRPRPLVAVEPGADRDRGGRRPTGCGRWSACPTPGAASSRTRPPRARWSRSSARASGPRATRSRRGGLQAEERPLVVYVSAHSHSSVDKAALLAGFGRDERPGRCAHDAALRDARPTRSTRRSARTSPPAAGRARSSPRPAPRPRPRSTPSARSPTVAREHGLWLHVDAAMAGSAMILPECRRLWDGHRGRRLAGPQPAQVARARRSTARSTTCATRSTSCA